MPYDPSSTAFWDETALAKELGRVANICHGCRLCFNLCPSFPNLLARVDEHDGDVSKLGAADYSSVVDDCYGCKLCHVKCPYTPPHEWNVDFPALMARERAVRARKEGVHRTDRFLAEVDKAGRRTRWIAPLANLANRLPPFRWVLEKTMGIHRKADLPPFRFTTFASWFKGWTKRRKPADPKAGAVAVFPTCYVNYNEPEIGKALCAVLGHHGVDATCPADRCCGMPFLDVGDVDGARETAARSLPALAAAAREGRAILVPQPTCAYMLQREWPTLLPGEDSKAVAKAVRDPGQWLMERHRKGALRTDFVPGAVTGNVGYHFACHLQAMEIGPKSSDLLSLIPGVEVTVSDKCSGHDGTYSFKAKTHDQSMKQGAKLFRAMSEGELNHVVSDCPLAARQIGQGVPDGPKPTHPLILLARAYGLPESP